MYPDLLHGFYLFIRCASRTGTEEGGGRVDRKQRNAKHVQSAMQHSGTRNVEEGIRKDAGPKRGGKTSPAAEPNPIQEIKLLTL